MPVSPTKDMVGAPGFEPGASCAQGSVKSAILLACLALYCVIVHGFGPSLSAFGPKLDPTFDRIRISLRITTGSQAKLLPSQQCLGCERAS
jgi:hypothetical protein